jgi:hypothetical protein
VCRKWNQLATHHLYESILIRSKFPKRTHILHRTLSAKSSPSFGRWTKRLDIVTDEDEDFEGATEEEIVEIVSYFTNLSVLVFHDKDSLNGRTPLRQHLLERLLVVAPSLQVVDMLQPPNAGRVAHMNLAPDGDMDVTSSILETAAKFSSLRTFRLPSQPSLFGNSPQDIFHNVTTLDLHPTAYWLLFEPVTDALGLEHLRFPSLNTIVCNRFMPPSVWLAIQQTYGSVLTTVSIAPEEPGHLGERLHTLSLRCPNIRTLILTFTSWIDFAPDVMLPPSVQTLAIKNEAEESTDWEYQSLLQALSTIQTSADVLEAIEIDPFNIQDLRTNYPTFYLKLADVVKQRGRCFRDTLGKELDPQMEVDKELSKTVMGTARKTIRDSTGWDLVLPSLSVMLALLACLTLLIGHTGLQMEVVREPGGSTYFEYRLGGAVKRYGLPSVQRD